MTLAIVGIAKVGQAALGWPSSTVNPPKNIKANGTCWELVQDPALLKVIEDATTAYDKANDAEQLAQSALTMAGSATRAYYSTEPATGTPRSNRDIWRQLDANKNIIAEWYWDGEPPAGKWVPTKVSSEAISNLDVGKLTAGDSTINSAVIQKLAVQIATVIELNADRITTGKLTTGQLDTLSLAAALATILELNADRITSGTIAAARLDVSDLAARIATIINLSADRITAGTINTARLNVQQIAAEIATIIQLNADRIITGQLKSARIDVVDLAANTGFIADLTARIVKSEMFFGKEFQGGTFTGSVFQTSGIASVGLKLDEQGMRVYGAEGGEPVTEIRADGGTVYSITDPVTGDTLASLDRDGGVSGQELNIAGDPVFLGSPLLGDTVNFQHPSEFETPGLLDVLPRGMIARAYRNISDRTSVTNQEMEILEFNYVHEPGRGYRITVAPFATYVGGDNSYGYLNVYITTDGSRPVMSSAPTFRQYVRNRNSSDELSTFGGVFYNVGYQPTARVVRVMVTIASEGGTMSFHPNSLASSVRAWVEDMGLSAPDTGVDRNGRMDLAVPTPVPPPEPPPPSKENYTQVWKSTGYRSFDGNGRYTYADGTNKIYQGTMGRTGMLRSMVTFDKGSKGQTITQALSGAKINSVKVTMRFDHWWSSAGGTAQIMLHGESGLTSSPPSMTLAATSSKWPKPGTRTVAIPSSRWGGFKNGDWKGIGLGNGSSGLGYYGYARASSVSLEIKYTK